MLFQSIALGLVGIMCILDSRLLGRMNFERPLIVSTLVGLVLGDLERFVGWCFSGIDVAWSGKYWSSSSTGYEYGVHYCYSFCYSIWLQC